MGFAQKNMERMSLKASPFSIEMKELVIGYRNAPPLNSPFSGRFEGAGIHLVAGRNGSGKSTLIRTLAGLQPLVSGSILWGGDDLSQIASKERGEGMAFMASTPPRTSGLRVEEVLELMQPSLEFRDRTLQQVGAQEWLDRRLSSLSDGQAQRVMLARALLQNTPWIALDEPTAFLDAPSRTAMWKTLLQLSELGVGLILASHDFGFLEGKTALSSVHAIASSGWLPLDRLGQASGWESCF
jgi:iron complex transport system ATP-binding protein